MNSTATKSISDLGTRPYSATCLIQARYSEFPGMIGFGTGFLVGQGRIATAAHVLWNDIDGRSTRKRLPDEVQVFLGNGLFRGYEDLSWRLEPTDGDHPIHPGFVGGDRDCDIARLQLPANPAAPLAVLGLPGSVVVGDDLTISGYPTEVSPFGLYEGNGPMLGGSAPIFVHAVPTGHGQSGAPVRVMRNGGWTVVGIHLGEADDAVPGRVANRGLALTPSIMAWLLADHRGEEK
ncbi:V8-like Glu-specific endopeptidase [Sphingomonas jinjuensis]|uniref:V8-like Glu-specific endopeptidase n=1 Tax=Sphingomonas jinjuensis TaxID=535907 RepID=A0A840FR48_9SPHN|nr:V8-like Glu-specific endopeptidase [Sphingomonas jinjuensis]